jgi:hypothetical protein
LSYRPASSEILARNLAQSVLRAAQTSVADAQRRSLNRPRTPDILGQIEKRGSNFLSFGFLMGAAG